MKRAVLIGQPNCGKSALFNAIAGYKANSTNFPGTTVSILVSEIIHKGERFQLVDLPGSYSLAPFDKAEEVNTLYAIKEDYDLIINVVDASILSRSLELTIEILDIGKPVILVLNMMDEAKKKGINIDIEKLSKTLNLPVVQTIAIYGEGVDSMLDKTVELLKNPLIPSPVYLSDTIEIIIRNLSKYVKNRFILMKTIEWDKIEEHVDIDKKFTPEFNRINEEIKRLYNKDIKELIFSERHHLSMKMAEEVTNISHKIEKTFEDKADSIFYHPFWGYIIFITSFMLMFYLVFKIGGALEGIFVYPFEYLSEQMESFKIIKILLPTVKGILSGTMGALGVIVPFMIPLVFFISLFEESGYLARSAFLFDSFMHKIGLHGKSIPPLLLGFGCNVPAISATRIIESERDRILTALLIPFIPCSARTIIISALVYSFLGAGWAFFVYFVSIAITVLVSLTVSRFMKFPAPGLIMEIPRFKFPSLKIALQKTWLQLKPFLYYATPILILGSIFVEYFNYYGADIMINTILRPITYVLGLPAKTGFTLVFGFLRKELALLMLGQSLGVKITEITTALTPAQILSFSIFSTLYVPCLATLLILKKEFNSKIAAISVVLNSTVALITTFIIISLLKLSRIL